LTILVTADILLHCWQRHPFIERYKDSGYVLVAEWVRSRLEMAQAAPIP